MVFKNALSFMLRSLLLGTHNLQVKDLLEVLKLLFKVYASMLCTIRKNALNICLALENYLCVFVYNFAGKQSGRVLQSSTEHFLHHGTYKPTGLGPGPSSILALFRN